MNDLELAHKILSDPSSTTEELQFADKILSMNQESQQKLQQGQQNAADWSSELSNPLQAAKSAGAGLVRGVPGGGFIPGINEEVEKSPNAAKVAEVISQVGSGGLALKKGSELLKMIPGIGKALGSNPSTNAILNALYGAANAPEGTGPIEAGKSAALSGTIDALLHYGPKVGTKIAETISGVPKEAMSARYSKNKEYHAAADTQTHKKSIEAYNEKLQRLEGELAEKKGLSSESINFIKQSMQNSKDISKEQLDALTGLLRVQTRSVKAGLENEKDSLKRERSLINIQPQVKEAYQKTGEKVSNLHENVIEPKLAESDKAVNLGDMLYNIKNERAKISINDSEGNPIPTNKAKDDALAVVENVITRAGGEKGVVSAVDAAKIAKMLDERSYLPNEMERSKQVTDIDKFLRNESRILKSQFREPEVQQAYAESAKLTNLKKSVKKFAGDEREVLGQKTDRSVKALNQLANPYSNNENTIDNILKIGYENKMDLAPAIRYATMVNQRLALPNQRLTEMESKIGVPITKQAIDEEKRLLNQNLSKGRSAIQNEQAKMKDSIEEYAPKISGEKSNIESSRKVISKIEDAKKNPQMIDELLQGGDSPLGVGNESAALGASKELFNEGGKNTFSKVLPYIVGFGGYGLSRDPVTSIGLSLASKGLSAASPSILGKGIDAASWLSNTKPAQVIDDLLKTEIGKTIKRGIQPATTQAIRDWQKK